MNWDEELECYNNVYNWKGLYRQDLPGPFLTPQCMLYRLYDKLETSSAVGKIFNISAQSVLDNMRKLGIPIKNPGHAIEARGVQTKKIDSMSDEQLSKMTVKEIAEAVNCSVSYAYRYLSKKKRPFKRLEKEGIKKFGRKKTM